MVDLEQRIHEKAELVVVLEWRRPLQRDVRRGIDLIREDLSQDRHAERPERVSVHRKILRVWDRGEGGGRKKQRGGLTSCETCGECRTEDDDRKKTKDQSDQWDKDVFGPRGTGKPRESAEHD